MNINLAGAARTDDEFDRCWPPDVGAHLAEIRAAHDPDSIFTRRT